MPFEQEITLFRFPIMGGGVHVDGVAVLVPDDEDFYVQSVTLDGGVILPGKSTEDMHIRQWLYNRISEELYKDENISEAFQREYSEWRDGDE